MQNDEMRERMFTMRLSREESLRLDALASHFGLNGAGVIRMMLKEKARDLGVEPSTAPAATVTPAKRKTAKKT